ncbi:ABC transporter periplasmic protein, partial [Candidatus Halobonum tyrrellensis G22]
MVVVLAGVAPAVGTAALAPVDGADGTNGATLAGEASPALDGPVAQQARTANCTFPVTVTDATGTEVTLDERPERVTTLGPSAAQTMWEIGGREQVVGVTADASYLDGADERTNVSGSGLYPSTETVVGTDPDLVLAPNIIPNEVVANMREADLTVYRARISTSIEDVREKTTRIGRITGNCAGAAEANAWMTANVEAATDATADLDRPTALYPLGGAYVANTGTFISAMIEAAGADNAIADANTSSNITGPYPEVNPEIVVQIAPEYLVLTDASAYLTAEYPYASTPAVEANNTVVVNSNYMSQAAPRSVVYAVRNLTVGFHPDADPAFVSRAEVDVTGETPESTPTPTAAPSDGDGDDGDDGADGEVTTRPTPTPTATPASTPATATTATTESSTATQTAAATETDAAATAAAEPTTAAATETADGATT